MMPKTTAGVEQFHQIIEDLFNNSIQGREQGPLKAFRAKAWDHFLELGLPTKDNECFRYIKLGTLFSQEFVKAPATELSADDISKYIYPECAQSLLVFINGRYSANLSSMDSLPKNVMATSFDAAAHTYGAFLQHQWAKSIKEETDPFAAVNAALHEQGLFVYLPPNTVINSPLQILSIVDTKDQSALITPRLHVLASARSQVEIVFSTALISGKGCLINQAHQYTVEESAHVKVTNVISETAADMWYFDALRSTLKKNSTFTSIAITEGSITTRHDNRISLLGENCEASLYGICMLKDRNEAHTHVLMDHQAPHARSMQHFKGILDGSSHSSFEGKILVKQAAQKTEAYQLNQNLLLSEQARAESKPNLEIFADDVKASHGATVGQLDQEQLFYLKARGCSNAEEILIQGFTQEILDKVTLPSLALKYKS